MMSTQIHQAVSAATPSLLSAGAPGTVNPFVDSAPARLRELRATHWRASPPEGERLRCTGEQMLRSARAAGKPLALLVLQVTDLPEVRLVFGPQAAEHVVDEIMTQLTHLAAGTGLALRTAPDTFALLMPAVPGETVHAMLRARLGRACWIEFELDGQEIVVMPDVLARTLGAHDTVERLHDELCRLIEAQRRLGQHDPHEVRHAPDAPTLRMDLPPAREQRAGNPAPMFTPALPPTMPMPLRAH